MKNLMKLAETLLQGRMPPLSDIPEPLLDAVASFSSVRGRLTSLSTIERVLTSFRHKEPDRVPATPVICAAGRQVKGIPFPEFATNAEKSADAYVAGLEFVGGDFLVLLWDLSLCTQKKNGFYPVTIQHNSVPARNIGIPCLFVGHFYIPFLQLLASEGSFPNRLTQQESLLENQDPAV